MGKLKAPLNTCVSPFSAWFGLFPEVTPASDPFFPGLDYIHKPDRTLGSGQGLGWVHSGQKRTFSLFLGSLSGLPWQPRFQPALKFSLAGPPPPQLSLKITDQSFWVPH